MLTLSTCWHCDTVDFIKHNVFSPSHCYSFVKGDSAIFDWLHCSTESIYVSRYVVYLFIAALILTICGIPTKLCVLFELRSLWTEPKWWPSKQKQSRSNSVCYITNPWFFLTSLRYLQCTVHFTAMQSIYFRLWSIVWADLLAAETKKQHLF